MTDADRSLASEHARDLAALSDEHAVTLESLLAVLRSPRLDDRRARAEAVDVAAAALVDLRTRDDRRRDRLLEPVVGAFARLRSDLRPLVRFGDLEVQFVEPPATGRALPGDVAHAARAVVRNAVLAIVDAGEARRVRVQWDCDGRNLLVAVRDDGPGVVTVHDDALRPVAEQVSALSGVLTATSTEGWGTELSVTLPLDPPPVPEAHARVAALSEREREVLRLVASGARNHDVAVELGIGDATVKFHVSNVLRKLGARSRAELAALVAGGAAPA